MPYEMLTDANAQPHLVRAPGGRLVVRSPASRWGGADGQPRAWAAPGAGEHTVEVLREVAHLVGRLPAPSEVVTRSRL